MSDRSDEGRCGLSCCAFVLLLLWVFEGDVPDSCVLGPALELELVAMVSTSSSSLSSLSSSSSSPSSSRNPSRDSGRAVRVRSSSSSSSWLTGAVPSAVRYLSRGEAVAEEVVVVAVVLVESVGQGLYLYVPGR